VCGRSAVRGGLAFSEVPVCWLASLQRRRISPSLFEAEQQVTESFFGIMFGGEFAIAFNRHVSIVPDARFYVVDRGEVTKPGYYLELPTTLFQSHVGVRVGL
jgi:hypothetical protein